MVRANLGLVHFALKRFTTTTDTYDDLYQVGCIGLLHAIDRFDPALGFKFSSYAVRCIRGYLMSHLTCRALAVRLPERLVFLRPFLADEEAALTQRLGRHPSGTQLAGACGVSELHINATRATRQVSIEGAGDGDLLDAFGSTEDSTDKVELESTLDGVHLTKRERFVADSLAAGMSQADVARALGVPASAISRLVRGPLREKLAFMLVA